MSKNVLSFFLKVCRKIPSPNREIFRIYFINNTRHLFLHFSLFLLSLWYHLPFGSISLDVIHHLCIELSGVCLWVFLMQIGSEPDSNTRVFTFAFLFLIILYLYFVEFVEYRQSVYSIYILFYYLLQKLFCCRIYQIYSNLNNCFVGVFVRFICSLVLKFLQSSVVCLWCVFYTVFGLHIVTLIIPVWAAQPISSKNLNKLQYLYL